ncbi:hypothetical protein HDU83_005396 [Entophlyctis luteolus]|nr:hypothetical protein HDU83_005396 [Entophlyctis luteolus]
MRKLRPVPMPVNADPTDATPAPVPVPLIPAGTPTAASDITTLDGAFATIRDNSITVVSLFDRASIECMYGMNSDELSAAAFVGRASTRDWLGFDPTVSWAAAADGGVGGYLRSILSSIDVVCTKLSGNDQPQAQLEAKLAWVAMAICCKSTSAYVNVKQVSSSAIKAVAALANTLATALVHHVDPGAPESAEQVRECFSVIVQTAAMCHCEWIGNSQASRLILNKSLATQTERVEQFILLLNAWINARCKRAPIKPMLLLISTHLGNAAASTRQVFHPVPASVVQIPPHATLVQSIVSSAEQKHFQDGSSTENMILKQSEIQQQEKFDVMLSYCWNEQSTVTSVAEYLRKDGLSVWMDIVNMTGETYAAMKAAVLNSTIFVACLSQKYGVSPVCFLATFIGIK